MINLLDRLLRGLEQRFAKGGPLGRWYPLYEAVDSFLFGASQVTDGAPHARDGVDLKRIMILVVISLVPCVFMAMWNTGYQANLALSHLGITEPGGWRGAIMAQVGCDPASFGANMLHGALYFLPVYLVILVVGGIWECLFNIIRGHEMSEAFLVTSLLFALILPPTIPLWQAAVGISFGIVFAKEAFGGVGRNFMNPALASRAFIFFAYPSQMSGDAVWTAVDGFSGATPLGALAAGQGGTGGLGLDWLSAFLGVMPGSMGETSALASILGGSLLLLCGIASWRVMAAMLLGALVAWGGFNHLMGAVNPMAALPFYWHLVLGGFAFGLVFMATDPVTSAHTVPGQWAYGLLIGALVMVIRVVNPAFPEGVMLAILLGNVAAPLFDYLVVSQNIKKRRLRDA